MLSALLLYILNNDEKSLCISSYFVYGFVHFLLSSLGTEFEDFQSISILSSFIVLFIMTCKSKVKVTLVQTLRLCTGRTAHRGIRGIALLFHYQRY